MEWTNVMITSVLNVFANTMGHVLLSSSPKILDLSADEIIAKIPKELSDIPERILIARTEFECRELGIGCEMLFFFRIDYVPRLIGV